MSEERANARNELTDPPGSVLHLTLKREWFDMIASGEKREEYREIKDYWIRRLSGKTFDFVRFRNGYSKVCPEMLVECKGIEVGYGKQRWGAGSAERFKIKLGRILSLNAEAGRTEVRGSAKSLVETEEIRND